MEFTVKENSGSKNVYDEDGDCVATFCDEFLYGIFVNGLVHYGGASLFDIDERKYIVGTVDQLMQTLKHDQL